MVTTSGEILEHAVTGEVRAWGSRPGTYETLVDGVHTIGPSAARSADWHMWRTEGFRLVREETDPTRWPVPTERRLELTSELTARALSSTLRASRASDVLVLDARRRAHWSKIVAATSGDIALKFGGDAVDGFSEIAGRVVAAEEAIDARVPARNADLEVLGRAPRLRRVALAYAARVNDKGISRLARCPALESLELPPSVRGRGLEALAGHASLRRVRRDGIDAHDAPEDLRAYGLLRGLRELGLSFFAPDRAGLDGLANLEALEVLDLTTGAALPTVAFLSAMGSLRRLRLFAERGTTGLAGALRGARGLVEVDLHGEGDSVAEALASCPLLRSIRLGKPAAPGDKAAPLGDRGVGALAGSGALKRVEVEGELTDVSLAALARLPSLTHLRASGRFTSAGIGALADARSLDVLELGSVSEASAPGLVALRAAGLPRSRLRVDRLAPAARPLLAKAFGQSLRASEEGHRTAHHEWWADPKMNR